MCDFHLFLLDLDFTSFIKKTLIDFCSSLKKILSLKFEIWNLKFETWNLKLGIENLKFGIESLMLRHCHCVVVCSC